MEKAGLVVLADNSVSIQSVGGRQQLTEIITELSQESGLSDKFNLANYRFGPGIEEYDTLNFLDKNTNIAKAMSTVSDVYANTNTAILLLTDGNQTLGKDYEFFGNEKSFPVYPIVIGDTTRV